MITKVISLRACGLWAAIALLPGIALGVDQVTVTGLFKDRAVLDLDGKTRVLSAGMISPEGVKLVSATSREAVLEINGVIRTYALGEHIRGQYAPAAAGASITIAPDGQGMYQVAGSINGFQVSFLVDTGATFISLNRPTARRIGLNYKLDGTQSHSTTASGMVPVWLVKLDRVRIGDIELRDVPASVQDMDFPDVTLLGNSFLQRLHLDRQGALLKLTKP
jgi:aspartyl protease family protein